MAGAGARWRVAEMRPGNQPLRRLAEVLLDESALGPERELERRMPSLFCTLPCDVGRWAWWK
jgi:hypothetical protein